MTALSNQRGTALVAALSIAMLLLPLGALVALQCRTDLSIQHNLRSEIGAFYVAEAGLAHAVAAIPPGRSFDALLSGPDQISGTTDDGVFPFAEGPPAAFPHAPFRYDVQVVGSGTNLIRIVSHATGMNGSEKVVEALLARSPLPFTPSSLYRETTSANLTLGTSFQISGLDHQAVVPPVLETQPQPPVPALSTPTAEAESALRTDLSQAAPGQLSGAGDAPNVATVARLKLEDYAASVANAPTASTYSTMRVDDATWGTPSAPQLSIVAGNLSVSGRLTGSGVLVVKGTFEVTGTVEFSGVVIALGAVLLEPSSTVTCVGALWQAASQDERLELGGTGIVAYSSHALSDLDRVFPGLLPHAAEVAGWQEQV